MPTVCHDCGSTSRDTPFPARRRGKLLRCCDCTAEFARLSDPRPDQPIRTRASYRAAYRQRAKQAQGDMIDMIVPPP